MNIIAPTYVLSDPNSRFLDKHEVGIKREFIRVTGGSGIIRDVSAVSAGPTRPPNLACGIKFQTGGSDWIVSDSTMTGFVTNPGPGKKYVNGDGFSTELPNKRVTFRGCQALENGDGGFDLKGPHWALEDCEAYRNAKNYRFWSSGRGRNIHSFQPSTAHVHICPSPDHHKQQTIELDEVHAEGPGVLFLVETLKGAIPPKIIIGNVYAKGVTEIIHTTGRAPEIIWR